MNDSLQLSKNCHVSPLPPVDSAGFTW